MSRGLPRMDATDTLWPPTHVQHGMPPLRVADLRRDRAIVELARDDAQALLESDPGLQGTQFVKLRKQVLRRYGRVLDVGDVG